jgi:non-ribosomal peptide synthetase component E (peptide arylation enzyme)
MPTDWHMSTAAVNQANAAGYICPDVELQVVDARDEPLPPGEKASLRIRGCGCVDTHMGDAGATAMFRNDWVYPGDVGEQSSDR